ncbi:MAG: hypothetical protein HYX41_07345 [Bdellovibrio sp.]|nr:hypothetical protein [Bdellovibrio sp.]
MMKSKKPGHFTPRVIQSRFPAAWTWFVDELIPATAKKKYSPKESWKEKPFSKEDARFFFKGIEELSNLFTEERPKGMVPYFNHPKYRCAYLLYFLPLQAAKFLTLFELNPGALKAALQHGREQKVLRIADIGAGPATASLAFLLWILENEKGEIPRIEFYWSDTQSDILKDGKELVESLSNQFPKLRDKVEIHLSTLPWWKSASRLPDELSLTFLGHVLNESAVPTQMSEAFWPDLIDRASGGGVLMVEPAARKSSQYLSRLRNELFSNDCIENTPQRIWGPCLHAGNCPLAEGRDWCHFSVPTKIPGEWFKGFSENLGSERQWVKFSYLWVASASHPAPLPPATARRVISDTLSQGLKATHLLCEPDEARKWNPPSGVRIWRGDVVKLSKGREEF